MYALQLHVAAFLLLIEAKSVSAAVKLIYSLLRQLISMTGKLPEVSESELTHLYTLLKTRASLK